MNEHDLRRGLAASAARAVPDDSRLSIDVLSRAANPGPGARTRRSVRFRLALIGAVAIATLGVAGAAAVAGGTFPVRFNLIGDGDRDKQPAVPLSPAEQAALEAKKRAEVSVEASGAKPVDANPKDRFQPVSMTLAEAQAAFGTQVLLPPGTSPLAVHFLDTSAMPNRTKPGAQPPGDTVELKFEVSGGIIEVFEERDATTDPLTVDALDEDGPMMKADGGLGRAAIETVAGGSYVVGYSVDGQYVATVLFKSSSGVAVTVRFAPGTTHGDALTFATSLE